jgi:hypothetical protein
MKQKFLNPFSLSDFKQVYCDENKIITQIIQEKIFHFFEDTILDAGCGLGDISYNSFHVKKVVLLDQMDFNFAPTHSNHTRLTGSLLNANILAKLPKINTLFLSHILQYIDSDLDILIETVNKINPNRIIIVEDLNNDFLGEILSFCKEKFEDCNGEVILDGFPCNFYKKIYTQPFKAKLKCPDFKTLAQQCIYLMDMNNDNFSLDQITNFLKKNLEHPTFTINQQISIYERK